MYSSGIQHGHASTRYAEPRGRTRRGAAARKRAFTKALFFVAKLTLSAACFWYVLRHIDVSEVVRTLPAFDFRWAACAVVVAMTQILLLALRSWAIARNSHRKPRD